MLEAHPYQVAVHRRVLAAPLQANYNFLLAQARNRVKDATQ